MKTIIKRNHIPASLVTAGTKDIRYYLNGLMVEIHRDRTFLVSTDGHRMSVYRTEGGDASAPAGGAQFIIPDDLCKRVGKAPRHGAEWVELSIDEETQRVTLAVDGAEFTGQCIEGKFPDWRRVMPACAPGDSTEPGQFNTDYIGDWSKVAKLLGDKFASQILIHHRGLAHSALVSMIKHPEFRGVMMPVRCDDATPPDTREFGMPWREEVPAVAEEATAEAACIAETDL